MRLVDCACVRDGVCIEKATDEAGGCVWLCFRGRFAKGAHAALVASGLAGIADGSAVQDETVAEVVGFLRREQGFEVLLDLAGIFVLRQTQFAADADAVCVGDDGGLAVDIAQN